MSIPSAPPKTPWFPWIGKRPFYGWIIVIIGAVSQFFQGLASQGFATYMGPLQTEFGWNKATLAGPRSVTQVEGAITGPLEGWLVDKFGPRKVVTAGVFIMGLGFILFGVTHSLLMYYISSIVIALGTGLQGLLVMSVTVNNWFRRKRTMAQSMMSLGYSMAGVIGVPVLVIVQSSSLGWRPSAIGMGLLIWALGFPFASLLRSNPESVGVLPDGDLPKDGSATGGTSSASEDEHDFTLLQAVKTRSFWLLAAAWAIGNLGLFGVQIHLFLHLEQGVGLSRATAALVWTTASFSNIPARLVGGFFGDRFPKNLALGASMAFMAAGIYLVAIAESAQMAFAYAVLFGIGWGMRTPIVNAVQGEYYGRKSQGIIRGWLQTLSTPISIAAPVLAGYFADLQGTYRDVFIWMALLNLLGAGLVLFSTRPKPPKVRASLAEDAEDNAAFEETANEPLISYDEMAKRLKKKGRNRQE